MDNLVLTIMVKNEESVIIETLEPWVKYGLKNYLIYDTGSTDSTVEKTKKYFSKNELNGFVIEEPFVDFATSRNKNIQHVKKHFPGYQFLVIDSEWYAQNIHVLDDHCKSLKGIPYDFCHITVGTTMKYKHSNLFGPGTKAYYKGVVHEYVVGNRYPKEVPLEFYIHHVKKDAGAASSKNRWYRDLGLLLKECESKGNDKDPRDVFYLGQTYECLGDSKNAIRCYKERANMQGFHEEKFMATYRVGKLYAGIYNKILNEKNKHIEDLRNNLTETKKNELLITSNKVMNNDETLNSHFNNAVKYFNMAIGMRPHRIEPYIHLCDLYPNEHVVKHMYVKQSTKYNFPGDILFVEKWMYDYERWDRLGITSYYQNEFPEMLEALKKAIPLNIKASHLHRNLGLCLGKLPNKTKDVKILNLILYSPGSEYDEMYEILTTYLNYKGINYYFYCFKEDIEEEYVIEGNIVYFKGKETFIPGILDKTLKVFELFKDYDCDYVVRSNISSVIDFDILRNHLYYLPCDFGGPYAYTGPLVAPNDGMTEEKHKIYKNCGFVGGACAIFSKKIISELLKYTKEMHELEMIDDLSIGICINMMIKNYKRSYMYFDHVSYNQDRKSENKILYRNKRENRKDDVIAMSKIVSQMIV